MSRALVSKQLLRALAVMGIRLTHSKPRQPAGRGKIERFFRTVREQFLVELAAPGALAKVEGLEQMNELFTAWVETVYHRRVHSETGQTPLDRFTAAGPPVCPSAATLREAFLWSESRLVAKTATVSMYGNTYEVEAALVGRRVELVFDPFDLTELQVRYQGRGMGVAVGHQIGRHVHPAAKPETSPDPGPHIGIDYLGLVRDRHTAALNVTPVNYADLTPPTQAGTNTAAQDDDDGLDAPLEAELARKAERLAAELQLEAELAAFAAQRPPTSDPQEVIPGQRDLLDLFDPTDDGHDKNPKEHQ